MSEGMWTKQFSPEGLVFFYNSSLNKSVWHPPEKAIIHIAPFLEYQQYSHLKSNIEGSNGCEPDLSSTVVTADASYDNLVRSEEQIDTDSANNVPVDKPIDGNANASRTKGNMAKRFKSNQSSESEVLENTSQSSYLRQKTELEAMMGCKKDDTSKWLVR